MRKINEDMVNAIKEKCNKHLRNTTVLWDVNNTLCKVRLHGNCICTLNTISKNITINMCGYPTNTTHSRLHAILQCYNYGICQKAGKQYLIKNLLGEREYVLLSDNGNYTFTV